MSREVNEAAIEVTHGRLAASLDKAVNNGKLPVGQRNDIINRVRSPNEINATRGTSAMGAETTRYRTGFYTLELMSAPAGARHSASSCHWSAIACPQRMPVATVQECVGRSPRSPCLAR